MSKNISKPMPMPREKPRDPMMGFEPQYEEPSAVCKVGHTTPMDIYRAEPRGREKLTPMNINPGRKGN